MKRLYHASSQAAFWNLSLKEESGEWEKEKEKQKLEGRRQKAEGRRQKAEKRVGRGRQRKVAATVTVVGLG
jgi:hypothetical protein